MIYVELKLFPECTVYDMHVDENAYVSEVVEELMCYVGEAKELFSVRMQARLTPGETLMHQGVKGGDTLVLVRN